VTRVLLALAAVASCAPRIGLPAHEHPVLAPQTLSVTAYCDTGTMADGHRARWGAAAGNHWPFGTKLRVGGWFTVTVEDRIRHGSDLDLAMPGNCPAALRWGRRAVTVAPV
jgi:3D (Asp-Asp-Asp) domain-containing protein